MLEQLNITDMLPQIIWTNDADGKANYFNKRWFEYTGLTYEQSKGDGWVAVAHEDDTDAVREWWSAFNEDRLFEAEARLRNKHNEYQWHRLTNVPYNDGQQKAVRWFGSATNIHTLKEERIRLRETSSYLKAILDAAVEFAIINLDGRGTIIAWNSGAEKMFGYIEQEAIGQHSSIVFTDEDIVGGIVEAEITRALQTGRSLDERWHKRKDGSTFFMSGVMAPMKDYDGFVKIARDITDRKLAEEALLLAEHRNNMAMDSAHMGEWRWDVKRGTLAIDEKARQILEMDSDTIDADSIWKSIHADDLSDVKAEFEKSVNGSNIFQSELRIVGARSGDMKWINCYGRVVSHEEAAPQMIGVLYDITERKALEKQKDDFISVASHELKTPVTSIKAYTEYLLESFQESDETQSAAIVQKLNGQVDRLIHLFTVLIDSTKITHGRMAINIETFDLNDLALERIEELRGLAGDRNLIFNPARIGLVKADKEKIGQVLTNMLSNAIKYGGNSEVIISSEDALDGAVIKVRDFGPGIAAEDRAHVFKQYYRGSGQRLPTQPGFGLGLYIAAEIIRQHHGLIGVDSTPGEGSTFYFKLFYT